jgi:hypothetical protein
LNITSISMHQILHADPDLGPTKERLTRK